MCCASKLERSLVCTYFAYGGLWQGLAMISQSGALPRALMRSIDHSIFAAHWGRGDAVSLG